MAGLRLRSGFAWLALFALGLQLVLSFAHHHHHEGREQAVAAAPASGVHFNGPDGRDNHDHGPADHDDDSHCAICWAMAVSHVLLLPLLLAGLIVPLQPDKAWTSIYTTAPIAGRLAFPFAPRGPPGF